MSDVTARILLWGIEGSGKTTTLETIYSRLRPDLRGELRRDPTRLDPTVCSEVLPIMLGPAGSAGSALEVVAVPGAADQKTTRKQLLDRVDGLILVLDCSPERIDANAAAIEELRGSLAAYGLTLEGVPTVVQYNKRDIADPFAIEALHRRIGLETSAVFETIATTGHGVLAALTTISKHVVRARRSPSDTRPGSESSAGESGTTHPAASAPPPPRTHEILEAAILAEGEEIQDESGPSADGRKPDPLLSGELRIVSVGEAGLAADGGVRVPLVLGDAEGRTRSVVLSLRLDPLLDDGGD